VEKERTSFIAVKRVTVTPIARKSGNRFVLVVVVANRRSECSSDGKIAAR